MHFDIDLSLFELTMHELCPEHDFFKKANACPLSWHSDDQFAEHSPEGSAEYGENFNESISIT